jgi:mRNA-degrading endonuclease YafQ of YafQ-DinJ toxin-antitoxin module
MLLRDNKQKRLKMTTKGKLKKEIDELPQNLLDQVYQFINSIKEERPTKNRLRSFKLRGQFDDVNIREKAYE